MGLGKGAYRRAISSLTHDFSIPKGSSCSQLELRMRSVLLARAAKPRYTVVTHAKKACTALLTVYHSSEHPVLPLM
jgi:hypothetical protein